MATPFAPPLPDDLPDGWSAHVPQLDDVPALVGLSKQVARDVTGASSSSAPQVASEVAGTASWTRRQVVVSDAEGAEVAWARVHDRAAGRTGVELSVSPELPSEVAARVASSLLAWSATVALRIAQGRGLGGTKLDVTVYEDEERKQQWLAADGYECTRTWLHMSRPVTPEEGLEGGVPAPREGLRVRRVATHDNGLPVAHDLQVVHRMLEESFADHFNSYRESFPEFVQRLREDPGHRWDHWWIAELDVAREDLERLVEGGAAPDDLAADALAPGEVEVVPGGAVVSTVSGPDAEGIPGSYIEYIGVHRLARGRGVAKALLWTVVADAAERGRNRVGLEVDADSPTGADGLYTSMGWRTTYRTQSWHRTLMVPGSDGPVPQPAV